MARRLVGIGLIAALLGAGVRAQAPDDNAGYGATYRRVPLQPVTGNRVHLGCADVGGLTWISARDPQGQGNHRLYAIDAGGSLVATAPQPTAQAASAFGMRDLCTDGTHLAGGSEAGISIVDLNGAPASSWDGHPVPAQPIAGGMLALLAVPRALCWDGAAAGGAGRFYAANGTSPICEFDLAGNVTGVFANAGWDAAGLALDRRTGNLWIDACPSRDCIGEIDRAGGTWQPTGRRLQRAAPGGAPGGLSEGDPAAGRHAPWSSQLLLLGVSQGGEDTLTVQRVDLWSGRRGNDEVVLEIGTGSGPVDGDTKRFGALDTLVLRLRDPLHLAAGAPAWVIWNFPPQSHSDDLSDLRPLGIGFGLLPEHRTHNPFSTMPVLLDLVTGTGVDTTLSLPLGPVVTVPPDMLVRAQAIWFDPTAPHGVVSTNEVHWIGGPPQTGILVAAEGGSSYEPSAVRGYWRIRHLGGAPAIRSVTLDWTAMATTEHPMVFDVAEDLGGRSHEGGNGAAAGCRGTFRAGSDAACGLDYGFAANHRAPCAAGLDNAGFTIDVGDRERAQRLTYRFVGAAFGPGRELSFDCDTDGGNGGNGAAMAGLSVRVELVDGTVRNGVLAVDPWIPQRAFAQL